MVVCNDADGLSQTLQSVEAIAEEIIVVVTGSTDNTRETARQFNSTVVDFTWCDDFSAARNQARAHVTGDWILWLDAGETLTKDDAADLKQAISSGALDTSTAYLMVVKPPTAPGVIAAEQIARIRLVPNREGVRFQGRVRESLHETLENVGIALDGLPHRIHRHPREHDQAIKRRRAQRNLRLADLEIAEHGRCLPMINCLAEAAQTLGNCQRAVDLYTECLGAEAAATADRLEAYYGLLTLLDGTPNARDAQLSLCVKALEEFPLDAQLLCAMGGYLQADNRLDLAIRSYQTAYEYGRVNPLVWHLDEITAIAAVCHSAALQTQGSEDAALDVLQNAVIREGNLPRLRRSLMELHIKHGRQDVACQQVRYLVDNDEDQTVLCEVASAACLASRRQWREALTQLQVAYEAGCRDITCLRWLAVAMLAVEQFDEAMQMLQAWREHYPTDPEPLRIIQALGHSSQQAPANPSEQAKLRIDIAEDEPTELRIVQPNVVRQ